MEDTNKNLSLSYLPTAEEAAQEAGKALEEALLKHYQSPTLLLLSGGSALKILDFVDEKILGDQLTATVLDERFSADPAVNNFSRLQDTDFYLKALERDASFFGTLPRKDDTKETMAGRLENSLKSWRQENPQGKTIAMLGMGPDGHTAGIMPFPEDPALFHRLFENVGNWVVAYNAGNKNPFPERITATLTFFPLIDEAVAFVSGTEKKPALDKVLSRTGNAASVPALAWHQIKRVQIFTDIK